VSRQFARDKSLVRTFSANTRRASCEHATRPRRVTRNARRATCDVRVPGCAPAWCRQRRPACTTVALVTRREEPNRKDAALHPRARSALEPTSRGMSAMPVVPAVPVVRGLPRLQFGRQDGGGHPPRIRHLDSFQVPDGYLCEVFFFGLCVTYGVGPAKRREGMGGRSCEQSTWAINTVRIPGSIAVAAVNTVRTYPREYSGRCGRSYSFVQWQWLA